MKNHYEVLPGGIVKVYLDKGLCAIVEVDDLALIAPYRWYAHNPPRSTKWYASTSWYLGGGRLNQVKKLVSMHALIMGHDVSTGMDIDHINGNGLDNRRRNLRSATRTQTNANRGKYRNNSTGYKGVYYYPNRETPYWAYITCDRKRKSLGYYATAEEAALAYNKAAKELFGEYAHLNNLEVIH